MTLPCDSMIPAGHENGSQKSHIETIPPDIRRLILSQLEFQELKALVHASPIYHQQYIEGRKQILLQYLNEKLGKVAFDAYAIQQSGTKTFSEARTKKNVADFVKSLKERRSSSRYPSPQDITLDDAVSMVMFYHSVRRFGRHYADWALANLAQQLKTCPHREAVDKWLNEPLSETEQRRILRGLYRFQLCSNLFGSGPHRVDLFLKPGGNAPLDLLAHEIFAMIEDICEAPWEIEELSCVDAFVGAKCTTMFEAVRWDFQKNNPKYTDGKKPKHGIYSPHGGNYRIGAITQGIPYLETLLFDYKDHEHRISILENTLIRTNALFLRPAYCGALGEEPQNYRRRTAPSQRDEMERRRDPLPFRGDELNRQDGLYPPLAWTTMWGATYSNMVGYYIGDPIAVWGYVMWDAARLKGSCAEHALVHQWTYPVRTPGDPRDQMNEFR